MDKHEAFAEKLEGLRQIFLNARPYDAVRFVPFEDVKPAETVAREAFEELIADWRGLAEA